MSGELTASAASPPAAAYQPVLRRRGADSCFTSAPLSKQVAKGKLCRCRRSAKAAYSIGTIRLTPGM